MQLPKNSIFVNYRRDETGDMCGRLADYIKAEFGENSVFKDDNSIPSGEDFSAFIYEHLPDCRVCLVLIGPTWVNIKDSRGLNRLDDYDDHVRLEIEAALAHKLRVVPILVNGAKIPRSSDLPQSLRPLLALQFIQIDRDPQFRNQTQRLIEQLREFFEQHPAEEKANLFDPKTQIDDHDKDWTAVNDSLLAQDYREFQEQYPQSPHVTECTRRIEQLKTWRDADKWKIAEAQSLRQQNYFEALKREIERHCRQLEEVQSRVQHDADEIASEAAWAERKHREAVEAEERRKRAIDAAADSALQRLKNIRGVVAARKTYVHDTKRKSAAIATNLFIATAATGWLCGMAFKGLELYDHLPPPWLPEPFGQAAAMLVLPCLLLPILAAIIARRVSKYPARVTFDAAAVRTLWTAVPEEIKPVLLSKLNRWFGVTASTFTEHPLGTASGKIGGYYRLYNRLGAITMIGAGELGFRLCLIFILILKWTLFIAAGAVCIAIVVALIAAMFGAFKE